MCGADLTIANLEILFHDYESSWQWTGGTYTRSDPRNLQELKWLGIDAVFTASIDQGCTMFAGHGPHFLRGIEIYKGAPIFYSLGNFIFQNDTITAVPAEAYARFKLDADSTPGDFFDRRSAGSSRGFPVDPVFWQSVVAVCDYEEHALKEVRLYPVDLGFGKHVAQRGRPVLADERVGGQVLEWLRGPQSPTARRSKLRTASGTSGLRRPRCVRLPFAARYICALI